MNVVPLRVEGSKPHLGFTLRAPSSLEAKIIEAYDRKDMADLYFVVGAWATATAREHGLSVVDLRESAEHSTRKTLALGAGPNSIYGAVRETLNREIQMKSALH